MNRPTVQVSLHFAPCKLVVALFSEVLPLFWLISLPVRELPSMWKAFLFHSSLTGAQHPSQFPSLFFKNHPFYLFFFTYLMSVLGLCCRMNFFSNCSLQASHCGGFSCWRVEHRLQSTRASAAPAPRLQSTGSAVVMHGLSCSVARGIFPGQG